MFRNILVAIDGSPAAMRGFKEALTLAKEQGATLHVLHVIDQYPMISGFADASYIDQRYVEEVAEGLRKQGVKLLDKAEGAADKDRQTVHKVLVDAGLKGVAQAILSQVRKLKVDLIVMGTHGRRGLERLVMGSDAEEVLRAAPVPVLLIRSGIARHRGKRAPAARTTARTATSRAAARASPASALRA